MRWLWWRGSYRWSGLKRLKRQSDGSTGSYDGQDGGGKEKDTIRQGEWSEGMKRRRVGTLRIIGGISRKFENSVTRREEHNRSGCWDDEIYGKGGEREVLEVLKASRNQRKFRCEKEERKDDNGFLCVVSTGKGKGIQSRQGEGKGRGRGKRRFPRGFPRCSGRDSEVSRLTVLILLHIVEHSIGRQIVVHAILEYRILL